MAETREAFEDVYVVTLFDVCVGGLVCDCVYLCGAECGGPAESAS